MNKLSLTIFVCFLACLTFAQEAEYTDFVPIMLLDTGEEVSGRMLEPEEAKKINFESIREITIYQVDPFTEFILKNEVIYLAARPFLENRRVYVVHPAEYDGEVLAITPDSYIFLMEQGGVFAEISGSEAYFKVNMYEPTQPNVEYRVIDPAQCNNAEHGEGEPHETDPGDPKSACHGSTGDSGKCRKTVGNITYQVSCTAYTNPKGENRDVCTVTIACADGGEGKTGDGSLTRTALCRTGFSCCYALAGTSDADKGFGDCGLTSASLDCAR